MTRGVPSPGECYTSACVSVARGVTPVLVSVWPVVSVNRLFAASLSEIESAAADWGLTGTRPLLLSAHTFSHRENPHHRVQMQTVRILQFVHTDKFHYANAT